MAGLGRKVFTAGEVLRAADVNGYLMDQSVQVYAGTAARGSAIGTATTAGMVSYLTDQSKMQLATGTATWVDIYPQSPFSPNYIINGGFDIWQRGTSFSSWTAYSADRWTASFVGVTSATITRDTSVPSSLFNYSMKVVPSSNATASEFVIRQPLEQQQISSLGGQTARISFWYKSTKTSGKVRVFVSNATGGSDVSNTFTVVANTWTYISYQVATFSTVTSWSTVNGIGAYVDIGFANSTAVTTSDNFYVTGVQLEIGSAATTFRRNANSIQGELAACQRYYFRKNAQSAYGLFGYGRADGTTSALIQINFPVEMRDTPSSTIDWTGTGSNYSLQGQNVTAMSVSSARSTKTGFVVYPAVASGLTTGGIVELVANNTTAPYLGFSAEL